MNSFVPRTSGSDIRYGQSAGSYYWNTSINPYTYYYEYYDGVYVNTLELALPNCTCYAWGRVKELGSPDPHNPYYLHNASAWHANLINGWTYVPAFGKRVQVGSHVLGAGHEAAHA